MYETCDFVSDLILDENMTYYLYQYAGISLYNLMCSQNYNVVYTGYKASRELE
jgi:hypothetical protein